jgi:hypothetical protein
MIWSDPWIDVATTPSVEGEGIPPFCTTLPPPRPVLPLDLRFDCCAATSMTNTDLSVWRDMVGTRWSVTALRQRLGGAWVARLHLVTGQLVSTCVLRHSKDPTWILETLTARPTGHGYATALVRSVMTWIYDRGGPFVLAYTWELSLAQMAWAFYRGWLKSAASVEYGWLWKPEGECGFCGSRGLWPVGPANLLTLDGVTLSDSGLGDGLGYVLDIKEEGIAVDWTAIAQAGGWRALWWRGRTAPSSGWFWTGEFVVVGLLNYDGLSPGVPTRWITAEI